MGNVAIARTGRIFYTIHPETNLDYPKLYERMNGKPVPWPVGADPEKLFACPHGVRIHSRSQLWIIDPANHGTGQVRLIAFDVDSGKEVHRFDFPGNGAPLGSFLQDMSINPDGRWVYIADVGFWAKRPAIVVYDTESRSARCVLNLDASVFPQNILIRNPIKPTGFLGGLLEMRAGVDVTAVSRDGPWVYYAAIRTQVQAVGRKPLNDGITTDDAGNVFLTDFEHAAVLEMTPDGKLSTVIKDKRIRWADGLLWSPIAGSTLPTPPSPTSCSRTPRTTPPTRPIMSGASSRGPAPPQASERASRNRRRTRPDRLVNLMRRSALI